MSQEKLGAFNMSNHYRAIKSTRKYEELCKKAYWGLVLNIVLALPIFSSFLEKIKLSSTSLNAQVTRLQFNINSFMSSYGTNETLKTELDKVSKFNEAASKLNSIKEITTESADLVEKSMATIIESADAAKSACYSIYSTIESKEGVGAGAIQVVEMFTPGLKILDSSGIKEACLTIQILIDRVKEQSQTMLNAAHAKAAEMQKSNPSVPGTTTASEPTSTPASTVQQPSTSSGTSLEDLSSITW